MNTDKLKSFIIAIVTGFVIAVSAPSIMFAAATEDEKEISIDILPESVLFDVDNMKPGDWAPREVVIKNNGKLDFDYFVTVQNENDSKKLFNELILKVNAEDLELYNGKLKDFKELPKRSLVSMDKEGLEFTVRFPEHLGNEYQGLQTQFSLIFTAESEESSGDVAKISSIIGSSGSSQGAGLSLPDTATNMFTFLLIGALFIFFGGLILLINKKIKNLNKYRA